MADHTDAVGGDDMGEKFSYDDKQVSYEGNGQKVTIDKPDKMRETTIWEDIFSPFGPEEVPDTGPDED